MAAPVEITLTSPQYWADHTRQLLPFLSGASRVIPDPTGVPADPARITVLVAPHLWTEVPNELTVALRAASLGEAVDSPAGGPRYAAGAAAPVGDRLVFTVPEAAALLGISRSFAYEAVERGEIPSMRIGRRILVPKAALARLLELGGSSAASSGKP